MTQDQLKKESKCGSCTEAECGYEQGICNQFHITTVHIGVQTKQQKFMDTDNREFCCWRVRTVSCRRRTQLCACSMRSRTQHVARVPVAQLVIVYHCLWYRGKGIEVNTLEVCCGSLSNISFLITQPQPDQFGEIHNVFWQPWSGERGNELAPDTGRRQYRPARRIRIQAHGGEGDGNRGCGLLLGPDWNRWGLLYQVILCATNV